MSKYNIRDIDYSLAFWLSLAGTCLFYLHPYYGIRHDSILYFGQVLMGRYPEYISNDLFFKYGSQAKYSRFPELMSLIYTGDNYAVLFKYLTLFSSLIFAIASYLLLRIVFPSKFSKYGCKRKMINEASRMESHSLMVFDETPTSPAMPS